MAFTPETWVANTRRLNEEGYGKKERGNAKVVVVRISKPTEEDDREEEFLEEYWRLNAREELPEEWAEDPYGYVRAKMQDGSVPARRENVRPRVSRSTAGKAPASRPKALKSPPRPKTKSSTPKPVRQAPAVEKETSGLTRPLGGKMRKVQWLWNERIPLGAVSLLAGYRGAGKTMMLCDIISQVTTGTLDGELKGEPSKVLYIFPEDSEEMTIRPRLAAAGCDDRMVVTLNEKRFPQGFVLSNSFDEIRRILSEDEEIRVLVIDPLSGTLTTRQRDSGGAEMRLVLQEAAKIADEFQVAVLLSAHFRKASDADVLNKVLGSSELVNVVRAVIALAKYDGEEYGSKCLLVSQEKNNLGKDDLPGLVYKVSVVSGVGEDYQTGESISAPRVELVGETERTVGDISREQASGKTREPSKASVWLKELLKSTGPIGRPEIVALAAEEGISRIAVDRAKADLGITAETSPENRRVKLWSLPQ